MLRYDGAVPQISLRHTRSASDFLGESIVSVNAGHNQDTIGKFNDRCKGKEGIRIRNIEFQHGHLLRASNPKISQIMT